MISGQRGRGVSRWVLASCIALGGCGSNSSPNGANGNHLGSSGGNGSSGGGNGASGGGSGGQFTSTSSGSGGGPSSGSSSGTSSGMSGDEGGAGGEAGNSSDASSGASGGSGSDSGSSGGSGGACSGGFAGYIRGPAPTSSSASVNGPYKVQSYAANASVRATMAYDVTSAHIYYPMGATAPFTAVAIVPGFTAAESSIANWAPFFASYGIITMTIGTSNPSTGAADTSVQPPVREAALLDALTTIKGENTRSGGPLVGMVDTARLAVAGWSMGGGGTLLAANSTPSLEAAMAMCPWNPSTTYPMDTVATLMFGGTADTLAGAPMPDNQYNSIPMTTPKALYVINGGSHFVANDPTTNANIARLGLSWMKVFLECDERFRPFIPVKPSDASEFMTTVQ
jgi:dienelactone hydrolase